jgi:predicted dehydrogenase
MFAAAARRGLVLVEAFMYLSHPLTRAVLDEVRAGAVGNVRLVRTSLCYRARTVEGNARFAPQLAGGALLDVGCYCVSYSRLVAAEEPSRVEVLGHLGSSGVEDHAAGLLEFPGGVHAVFSCGISVQADNTASICGDEAHLEVPVPWKPPPRGAAFVVRSQTPPRMDGGGRAPEPVVRTIDAGGHLYGIEADAFAASVLDGAPAPVTRDHTLGNLRVLDALRARVSWGPAAQAGEGE